MNKRYDQSPRFSAAGVITCSILALIVAMAISVAFDVLPVNAAVKTTTAAAAAIGSTAGVIG
jgi:hypothetical protein